MKKLPSNGVMPGAVSFLSGGSPTWGFGNLNQMIFGLSEPTERLRQMEDEEINANAEHECRVLGKGPDKGTQYNLPNTMTGNGIQNANKTDLEQWADEQLEEQTMMTHGTGQRQSSSLTSRGSQDSSYFDMPGTPKEMWHADPQNHIPFDMAEVGNADHFDDWLGDMLADQEAEETGTNVLSLARNLEKGSPNDWKSTTPTKQGSLVMTPQKPDMALVAPKRHSQGSLKEQADSARWYMRTLAARAVSDVESDTIRHASEPLLFGDPKLDPQHDSTPNVGMSHLVAPKQWIKKEKDTDVRVIPINQPIHEERRILLEWGAVAKQLEPLVTSWILSGRRESLRSLYEVFEIIEEEECNMEEALQLVWSLGCDVASSKLHKVRLNQLYNVLEPFTE